MRFKKILASFMTAGMMLTFIPTVSMAATVGWNGNDSDGWRYYTTSSSYVKNDWKKIDGKWYYFNSNGYMESNCYRDGYWLTKSGAWDGTSSHGTWEKNSNGWWYEDSGWYPVNRWLWIDGECYYFDSKGFMEYNCYRDGCWLSSSGAWDRSYSHGTWKKDSKGWWYEDNGWYPKSQWLWIDGAKYRFSSIGYWIPYGDTNNGVLELKSFLKMNFNDAVNDLNRIGFNGETYTYGFSTDYITLSRFDSQMLDPVDYVLYISIHKSSSYSIYGVTPGMTLAEAEKVLVGEGNVYLKEGNTCVYRLNDGKYITICLSSNKISSVYYASYYWI